MIRFDSLKLSHRVLSKSWAILQFCQFRHLAGSSIITLAQVRVTWTALNIYSCIMTGFGQWRLLKCGQLFSLLAVALSKALTQNFLTMCASLHSTYKFLSWQARADLHIPYLKASGHICEIIVANFGFHLASSTALCLNSSIFRIHCWSVIMLSRGSFCRSGWRKVGGWTPAPKGPGACTICPLWGFREEVGCWAAWRFVLACSDMMMRWWDDEMMRWWGDEMNVSVRWQLKVLTSKYFKVVV